MRPVELALVVPLVGLLLFLSAWPALVSERAFPLIRSDQTEATP